MTPENKEEYSMQVMLEQQEVHLLFCFCSNLGW